MASCRPPAALEKILLGGFKYENWVAPFGDEASEKIFQRLMKPSDLLLGRKTFEIWENFWPQHEKDWPGVNDVTKYVLSITRNKSDWKNTNFLTNLAGIKKLKESTNTGVQVWGSADLIQLLLKNDLVDDLWLMIYPLTLGNGKKLFQDGPIPAAFTLVENTVTPGGVIIANYKRAGDIKTGTIGE